MLLLKKRDGLLKTFGAWTYNCGHRYRLNSILRDWHIKEIESKYRFSLPKDYREYLHRVGNGGAGPYYGLFTLEESLLYETETLSAEFLSSPFPHEAAFNPFQEGVTEEEESHSRHVCGSIAICGMGCGDVARLVIAGPQRGMVWTDNRANYKGFSPTGQSFYDWYDYWLTTSLSSLRVGPFSWLIGRMRTCCEMFCGIG